MSSPHADIEGPAAIGYGSRDPYCYYAPEPVQQPRKSWWPLLVGGLTVALGLTSTRSWGASPPAGAHASAFEPGPLGAQQLFAVLPGYTVVPLVQSTPLRSAPFSPMRPPMRSPVFPPQQRSGSAMFAGPLNEETISKMRIKEIKAELKSRNVGCDDCFEKSDLVARLLSVVDQPQAPKDNGIVLQMPAIKGAQGMLGAAVNTADANVYYVMDAQFPKSQHPEASIQLMVDTAATVSLVTPEAVQYFGGKRTGVTASGTSAGGDANTAGYQVTLGPLTLAGQPFNYEFKPVVADVPAATPNTKGILGLDFMTQFDVFFDFEGQRSVLYPKATVKNTALVQGMLESSYRVLPIGLCVADVRVFLNGQEGNTIILGILDTGASGSIMNSLAAAALGLGPNSPGMMDNGMVMAGQDGMMVNVKEVAIDVAIGAETQAQPTVMAVADLPGFVQMGIADKPMMLLGADVLRQRKGMVLSTYDRKFWLGSP